jgi:hypothetical protein
MLRTALALLTASAVVLAGGAAAGQDKPSVERDLVLVATVTSGAVIQPGQTVETTLTLSNRSRGAVHRVVRPGDGSDDGRREPHVWFTAEMEGADGSWSELPKARRYGCKVFDPDWRDDVVDLQPGESLDVRDWAAGPNMYELQLPGRVRLIAHYAYRAQPVPAGDVGEMADLAPFEIASEPVYVTVERPLDVSLEVVGEMPAEGRARLGALVNVRVRNDSAEPLRFDPGDWEPVMGFDNTYVADSGAEVPEATENPVTLAPGESRVVYGTWSVGHDVQQPRDAASPLRLRVTLRSREPGGPAVKSAWVSFPAERAR